MMKHGGRPREENEAAPSLRVGSRMGWHVTIIRDAGLASQRVLVYGRELATARQLSQQSLPGQGAPVRTSRGAAASSPVQGASSAMGAGVANNGIKVLAEPLFSRPMGGAVIGRAGQHKA